VCSLQFIDIDAIIDEPISLVSLELLFPCPAPYLIGACSDDKEHKVDGEDEDAPPEAVVWRGRRVEGGGSKCGLARPVWHTTAAMHLESSPDLVNIGADEDGDVLTGRGA
jgi:hypothetical protein